LYDRISQVKKIDVSVVTLGAILQVGDSIKLSPKSKVLAEQYTTPDFDEKNDGKYEQYSIFSKVIPQPKITESLQMNIINKSKVIKVNSVDILGLSSSGIVQIGSNIMMSPESRVKHIRHLHRQIEQ